RSSRRRVAVSDFCVTAGMARRSSLKRQGRSQSSSSTPRDHLSSTWSRSSRWGASMRSAPSVSMTKPRLVEVPSRAQISYRSLLRQGETTMTVQHFTPEAMLQPTPYHHVAVGTGTTHVHVSGQISRQADGTPVAPGDLAGQVARSLQNTGLGLTAAGASFADVLRLTFYVTGWTPRSEERRVGKGG